MLAVLAHMQYPSGKRPVAIMALAIVEAVFGLMGVISGILLIIEPNGTLIGFTEDIRLKVPFQTFLPVGLFLLLVYGVGSFLLAYGTWTRKELFLEKVSQIGGRHWAWTGGLLLMGVLLLWLLVEGQLIGLDFPATYMTVLFGLIIMVLLLMPSVRDFLTPPDEN
ncbi:MAG: hypothetical protein A4E32_00524 [Methanomassiliicoccales archaeon PtaU1.Bin124]|nr:MAG: hypothetical protein A4E32_00524 [Methanomassiliicoccales archaeon PtaU1.Bin124]